MGSTVQRITEQPPSPMPGYAPGERGASAEPREQSARAKQRSVAEPLRQTEPLADLLERRKQAIRLMDYETLGRIDWIGTERGIIDYGHNGPTLAVLPSGELLLLNKWAGLPDVIADIRKRKLCPDCRVKCDECKKGMRLCRGKGCGGQGFTQDSPAECPAKGCAKQTGKYNPECSTCGGNGIVFPKVKCKSCKGKKLVKCWVCEGTARRPTGEKRGKTCRTCNGNIVVYPRRPQTLKQFAYGLLEGMPLLGPITSIVFHTADRRQMPQVINVTPDKHGNLMALLLETATAGSDQHLIGGVPHLRSTL